jgi:hypothetical protein
MRRHEVDGLHCPQRNSRIVPPLVASDANALHWKEYGERL